MTRVSDGRADHSAGIGEAGCAVGVDPARRYATLTFMRGCVVALAIALISGVLGIVYYIPAAASVMQGLGVHFAALRPIHTTFVACFVFLGGVAIVHRMFEDVAGPMRRGERLRLRAQVVLWACAGIGVLGTLIAGVFSGREYMGFHPAFSIPILIGWLLFTWNFFAHVGRGLLARPIYITMWAVGALLFVYTFIEQHAWLAPGVFADPLVDLRVQWKATGTLIGSFNLFVYGSLYYLGTKLGGDETYAHSRLAYALFGVSLLNTFTSYGHHTYHLPQIHAVKWISFVISMTEIIILARVVWDIAGTIRATRPEPGDATRLFVSAARWWTAYILVTAIVISVPPINALIHGTQVVMAHGMGAMIGIDAMVLLAGLCWILTEIIARRGGDSTVLAGARVRRWIIGLNAGAAVLIGWLTISGVIIGVRRYNDLAPPEWLASSGHIILAGCGLVTAYFLARLIYAWLGLLFGGRSRRDP